MNLDDKAKFTNKLETNINQNLFSYTFQTLLLLNFLLEHFRIIFDETFYHT